MSRFSPFGGNDRDRDRARGVASREARADLDSIHPRQHQDEEVQPGRLLLRAPQPLHAVAAAGHGAAPVGNVIDEQLEDVRLVLYHEHFWRLASARGTVGGGYTIEPARNGSLV